MNSNTYGGYTLDELKEAWAIRSGVGFTEEQRSEEWMIKRIEALMKVQMAVPDLLKAVEELNTPNQYAPYDDYELNLDSITGEVDGELSELCEYMEVGGVIRFNAWRYLPDEYRTLDHAPEFDEDGVPGLKLRPSTPEEIAEYKERRKKR